jgi:hypothetical protein
LDERPVRSDLAGRLIQITLALYLIPVLLIVLAVGSIGMLVLAGGRLFIGPMHGPAG